MRVAQGGHDVPDHKLRARWPRTLVNLQAAIAELPSVLVFDNSDLSHPFRQLAAFEQGQLVQRDDPLPSWLEPMLGPVNNTEARDR
jgi:predicted ABC-type ATPase